MWGVWLALHHTLDHDPIQYRARPADPYWQAVADCAAASLNAEAPKVIVASDVPPDSLGAYRWYDDLVVLADSRRGKSAATLGHEIAHAIEARGTERGMRWWTPIETQGHSHDIDERHHGGDEFYPLLMRAESAVERCMQVRGDPPI